MFIVFYSFLLTGLNNFIIAVFSTLIFYLKKDGKKNQISYIANSVAERKLMHIQKETHDVLSFHRKLENICTPWA